MPVRRVISKADRVKVVKWIRSGAPVAAGVSIYATLPHNPRLLTVLQEQPRKYANEMIEDICALMGITRNKFQQIINEHGTKHSKTKREIHPGNKNARAKEKPVIEKRPAKTRSFRNEWSFLSRPECPPELKALAADKISCWERYTAAHKKLFDCSTLEECRQVAHELIENYKENQLIHEEFEYYQAHGDVLGKHRIWNHLEKFKNLRGKNIIELVRLYEKTLPHRIWRIESEIKKGDKPHLQGEREKRLNEAKTELAEVKRLLGINER